MTNLLRAELLVSLLLLLLSNSLVWADDVSGETLDRCGAVSEETAMEMAQGVQRISGATYGLSTSGIAGPGGGTDAKPVGTLCIALATADSVSGRRYHLNFGNRRMNKRIFAAVALNMLRRELTKHS